jgi:hypothetical protein
MRWVARSFSFFAVHAVSVALNMIPFVAHDVSVALNLIPLHDIVVET